MSLLLRLAQIEEFCTEKMPVEIVHQLSFFSPKDVGDTRMSLRHPVVTLKQEFQQS